MASQLISISSNYHFPLSTKRWSKEKKINEKIYYFVFKLDKLDKEVIDDIADFYLISYNSLEEEKGLVCILFYELTPPSRRTRWSLEKILKIDREIVSNLKRKLNDIPVYGFKEMYKKSKDYFIISGEWLNYRRLAKNPRRSVRAGDYIMFDEEFLPDEKKYFLALPAVGREILYNGIVIFNRKESDILAEDVASKLMAYSLTYITESSPAYNYCSDGCVFNDCEEFSYKLYKLCGEKYCYLKNDRIIGPKIERAEIICGSIPRKIGIVEIVDGSRGYLNNPRRIVIL